MKIRWARFDIRQGNSGLIVTSIDIDQASTSVGQALTSDGHLRPLGIQQAFRRHVSKHEHLIYRPWCHMRKCRL